MPVLPVQRSLQQLGQALGTLRGWSLHAAGPRTSAPPSCLRETPLPPTLPAEEERSPVPRDPATDGAGLCSAPGRRASEHRLEEMCCAETLWGPRLHPLAACSPRPSSRRRVPATWSALRPLLTQPRAGSLSLLVLLVPLGLHGTKRAVAWSWRSPASPPRPASLPPSHALSRVRGDRASQAGSATLPRGPPPPLLQRMQEKGSSASNFSALTSVRPRGTGWQCALHRGSPRTSH